MRTHATFNILHIRFIKFILNVQLDININNCTNQMSKINWQRKTQVLNYLICKQFQFQSVYELRHGKTNILHMQKQRRRSAL